MKRTSCAWMPGDPLGRRELVTVSGGSPLALERGGELSPVVVAYETWGTLDASRSNAVLVLHPLTGDSHAAGPAEPGHPGRGWWDDLVGPGKAIDTDRFFVVCPNALGGCQGTTGPTSIAPDGRLYGSRFPHITVRDQVAVLRGLADALEIERWAAVAGGSMGGMQALEWCVTHPDRARLAILIGTCAVMNAEQIALNSLQAKAIRLDPHFHGGDYHDPPDCTVADCPGPIEGMTLARRLGLLGYRTEEEIERRFGNRPADGEDPMSGGRFAVEAYLDHSSERLARRFDAGSYVTLNEAMMTHDVSRGRGSLSEALSRVTARVLLIGIDTDRTFPLRAQRQIADLLPDRSRLETIQSLVGHDALHTEIDAVGAILKGGLDPLLSPRARSPRVP